MSLAESRVLSDGVDSAVDEFMALSCLNEKADRFSMGIVGNVENDRNSMPANIFEKYKEIVVAVFEASVLKKKVKATILERYDDEKMRGMISFLKHPKVMIVNQREETSRSPQAMRDMQGFFAGLQASPPTEKRKKLIEKIDSLKRSSSFVVDMQVELFQAITWGMRGLNDKNKRITEEQLKQMALEMKTQLCAHMRQQVWMGMLYAYKDLSDSELESYISLHETAEGVATTEFVQSVYSCVYQQKVDRLRFLLEAEFC